MELSESELSLLSDEYLRFCFLDFERFFLLFFLFEDSGFELFLERVCELLLDLRCFSSESDELSVNVVSLK